MQIFETTTPSNCRCHECLKLVDTVVQLGDYGRSTTFNICLSCLTKAVDLITPNKAYDHNKEVEQAAENQLRKCVARAHPISFNPNH